MSVVLTMPAHVIIWSNFSYIPKKIITNNFAVYRTRNTLTSRVDMMSHTLSVCCSPASCLLAGTAANLQNHWPSPPPNGVNKQQIVVNGHCSMLMITSPAKAVAYIVIWRNIRIKEKYQVGHPLTCNIMLLLQHLTLSTEWWWSCTLQWRLLRTCW